MLKNSSSSYGSVSIALHWLMALGFIALYALGWWMVELDYYDSWYHRAPDLHKSIGISLAALMLLRLFWNRLQPRPQDLGDHATLNRIAHALHNLFYLLVLLLLVSGYLISTAKGKSIEIFQFVSIPALLPGSDERGELAGDIHEILANLFIALAALHAGAALKHHFLDRDATLIRMLRSTHHNNGDIS